MDEGYKVFATALTLHQLVTLRTFIRPLIKSLISYVKRNNMKMG